MDIFNMNPEEIEGNIRAALERLLIPIVDSIGHLERLKRREYLTPEEVEVLYSLKASTLANKRSRAKGPEYIKDGDKILYKQQSVKKYLESKAVLTRN